MRQLSYDDHLQPQTSEPNSLSVRFWTFGVVTPTAHAFDAAAHLKTIRPGEECWCGSGVPYRGCHRPADLNTQHTYRHVNREA